MKDLIPFDTHLMRNEFRILGEDDEASEGIHLTVIAY